MIVLIGLHIFQWLIGLIIMAVMSFEVPEKLMKKNIVHSILGIWFYTHLYDVYKNAK